MSGTQYNQDPSDVRPEDRLHETNPWQSARPSTTGVTDTGIPPAGQNYDATLGRTAGAGVTDEYNTTQGRTAGPGVAGQQYDTYFTTNRPLNVKPTPQGGVPIGGQNEELPFGYADMGDKIIGKTQKIMGKMTNNPELHEKGELRESSGKAVAHGLARVPPHV